MIGFQRCNRPFQLYLNYISARSGIISPLIFIYRPQLWFSSFRRAENIRPPLQTSGSPILTLKNEVIDNVEL